MLLSRARVTTQEASLEHLRPREHGTTEHECTPCDLGESQHSNQNRPPATYVIVSLDQTKHTQNNITINFVKAWFWKW